jgi:hypothetical protein
MKGQTEVPLTINKVVTPPLKCELPKSAKDPIQAQPDSCPDNQTISGFVKLRKTRTENQDGKTRTDGNDPKANASV